MSFVADRSKFNWLKSGRRRKPIVCPTCSDQAGHPAPAGVVQIVWAEHFFVGGYPEEMLIERRITPVFEDAGGF